MALGLLLTALPTRAAPPAPPPSSSPSDTNLVAAAAAGEKTAWSVGLHVLPSLAPPGTMGPSPAWQAGRLRFAATLSVAIRGRVELGLALPFAALADDGGIGLRKVVWEQVHADVNAVVVKRPPEGCCSLAMRLHGDAAPTAEAAIGGDVTSAGLAVVADLRALPLNQIPAADPGGYVAVTNGLWPGVSREPTLSGPDVETVSASREPWVDSNAYWIPYLRALYPKAAPVLAYEANSAAGLGPERVVPFDTLVLALAEARVMGGNYILSLDPAFRKALLAGDAKALAAWKQLGVTAKWLAENKALYGVPAPPSMTALVEPGGATAEIANLLFRRNGSPRLIAEVPERLPAGTVVLVTTSMKAPRGEVAVRILEQATVGGVTVVTDDPTGWWKSPQLKVVKTQSDRVFYSLGKGMVVAYNRKIVDPSEHALDVIDLVGHPRRAVRIWNANATIPVSSPGVVHLLNYTGQGRDTQVRIQGVYKTCAWLRPGMAPVALEAARRGTTTEVFVPEPALVSTLRFR